LEATYRHYASHPLTFKLGGSKVRFTETRGNIHIELAAHHFPQIGLAESASLNQITRDRLCECPKKGVLQAVLGFEVKPV
jgi:hypothetical protein